FRSVLREPRGSDRRGRRAPSAGDRDVGGLPGHGEGGLGLRSGSRRGRIPGADRRLSTIARRQHVVFLGGPGVRYEERPAGSLLAPWVAVFWRIETDVDFLLRIPPDGCMDLIGSDVVGSFSTFAFAHLPAG